MTASASVATADDRKVMVIAAVGGDPIADASVKAIVEAGKGRGEFKAGAGSLADSALILGCDPDAADCRRAVTEQLEVDELIVVRDGGGGTVAVESYRADGRPGLRTSYPVRGADDAEGLRAAGEGTADGAAPRAVDTGTTLEPIGPRTPPPTYRGMPRGAVYIGIGGGVLIVAGAVAWGLASAKQGEIDDAPTATRADLDHLADLESTGRAYAAAGNGLVIGGAIAVAAAGTWIYLHRRRESRVQVAPAVGPGTAAVTLGGTW